MEYSFNMDNFDAEVLQSELPVLVDFYADWCGPCKAMAPLISAIAEEYEGKLKVGKCDTEENMPLAQKYRISSIPNMQLFKGGEVIANFVGRMDGDDLRAKIDEALA